MGSSGGRERKQTVAHDVSRGGFDRGEEGGPAGEVGEVEFDVIVFGEDVEVGEVEAE